MVLFDLKENILSIVLRTVLNFIVVQLQWLVFKVHHIMSFMQSKHSLIGLQLRTGYRLSNSLSLLRISYCKYMYIYKFYKLRNALNTFLMHFSLMKSAKINFVCGLLKQLPSRASGNKCSRWLILGAGG